MERPSDTPVARHPAIAVVAAVVALAAGCSSNDDPGPAAPASPAYFQRLTGSAIAESSPEFSPDAKQVAYERGDEIWVLDVATRAVRRVAARGNHPTWSADGEALLFVRRDLGGGGPLHRLVRLHLEGATIDTVSADTIDAYEPAASPVGEAVALRVLSRLDTRQSLRVLAGDDEAHLTGPGPWVDVSPAWSPDGLRIAFVRLEDTGTTQLLRIPAGGDEDPAPLTARTPGISGPTWHPDGTRIFFSRAGRIFSVAATGGAAAEFITGDGFALAPTVSPDGRRLVFACDRSGNFELWQLVDPEGLGPGPYAF
jgi:Tol biopolymer transport system component